MRTDPEKLKLAAQLIAEGELTDKDIADRADVDPATVWRWRRSRKFMAQVDRRRKQINDSIDYRAISHKARRVDRQNKDWLRLQRLVHERAIDPTMAAVPGGTTGFLVRSFKQIGSGENATMVTEYTFDAALAREIRELEKHTATELGQWVEKTDQTSAGKTLPIVFVNDWRTTGTDDPSAVPPSGTDGGQADV